MNPSTKRCRGSASVRPSRCRVGTFQKSDRHLPCDAWCRACVRAVSAPSVGERDGAVVPNNDMPRLPQQFPALQQINISSASIPAVNLRNVSVCQRCLRMVKGGCVGSINILEVAFKQARKRWFRPGRFCKALCVIRKVSFLLVVCYQLHLRKAKTGTTKQHGSGEACRK